MHGISARERLARHYMDLAEQGRSQADIDVADFDSALCGLSAFACFQQPGTEGIEEIRAIVVQKLDAVDPGRCR